MDNGVEYFKNADRNDRLRKAPFCRTFSTFRYEMGMLWPVRNDPLSQNSVMLKFHNTTGTDDAKK